MAYLRLRKDLTQRSAPPSWPQGVQPVLLNPGNSRAVHELLTDAFPDFPLYGQWYSALVADSEYDPDLCVVALGAGGAIAGYVQCWTSCFIKDLVVAPPYRGSGIGLALMQHVFGRFAYRGAAAVDLKVAVDALPARRLYSRLGMVEVAH